jgi:hypothetical protein
MSSRLPAPQTVPGCRHLLSQRLHSARAAYHSSVTHFWHLWLAPLGMTCTQHVLSFFLECVRHQRDACLFVPSAGCVSVGGGAPRQCTCQPRLHVHLGGLLCAGAVY